MGCSLFIRFLNLPPGNSACVEPLYMVSEPTSRELLAGSAARMYLFRTYIQGTSAGGASGFQTFLQGTVGQGFIDCL